MSRLLDTLRKDCKDWISSREELLMNERDLQVKLAKYLEDKSNYRNVHMEYFVPLDMLASSGLKVPKGKGNSWSTPPDFPWHNQMYIDIVVEKDGKFAAVELKYATACIDKKLPVFNKGSYDVLKDEGAYNAVMYNYWKDVRRIEAVTRFDDVVGGVALIVSNAPLYWVHRGKKLARDMFSTHEGHPVAGRPLKWNGACSMESSHPAFNLDGKYTCVWEDTKIHSHYDAEEEKYFRYMMTVVEK